MLVVVPADVTVVDPTLETLVVVIVGVETIVTSVQSSAAALMRMAAPMRLLTTGAYPGSSTT